MPSAGERSGQAVADAIPLSPGETVLFIEAISLSQAALAVAEAITLNQVVTVTFTIAETIAIAEAFPLAQALADPQAFPDTQTDASAQA